MIKDITKRAAAESGIRQALTELEAWESYTSLPLQESKDSKNVGIYIVGDYSALLVRAGKNFFKFKLLEYLGIAIINLKFQASLD